jgi:hypothetical protein
MAWKLLFLLWSAVCCALFINTVSVFYFNDPVKTKPLPAPVIVSLPPLVVRVFPEFPQLAAAEKPPEPPDAGQPFYRLDATVGGIAWSSIPELSTAVLEFWREPDEAASVVRVGQVIKKDYLVTRIDKRFVAVLHRPSSTVQDFWLGGYEPEDAGPDLPPAPFLHWHKPWSWDPFY